nr:glycerate kinase [Actinomycetota bacterium]
ICGTGELVRAALRAGARRVVVGCGGSATTDGGDGAVAVLLHEPGLRDVELLVATDVTTRFLDAARVFAPQKGAGPDEVALLTTRLERIASRYASELGVDVTAVDGAGAAGGLAGGLAAVGGQIVSGFDLVADMVGLDAELARADLVLTGEGCLDETSLAGKVVSGVVSRLAGRAPALVVAGTTRAVGAAELAAATHVPVARVEVVDLTGRYGSERALASPLALVAEVVREVLRRSAGR